MTGWRGTWAKAQITGVVFSSLVWIVVAGLSIPALALILAVGTAALAGRNTRAMRWWRYGAMPANGFQRDVMLAAIVPIASLRGRHQPAIWIGRRLGGGHFVMPSRTHLVVSPELLRQVVSGQLTDRKASAIVSQALGHCQVHNSTLVTVMNAYCLPWVFVQILTGVASRVAVRSPILGLSWKIRWIVFGAAAVDAYRNSRWSALVGVFLIAVLSSTTSLFQRSWVRMFQDLGDQRAISEGLGPDLADLIQRGDRSVAASERADRLRRGARARATGSGDSAPGGMLPATPPADHLERRGCAGRRNR